MPTTDPRVDAYIEQAREFARPILTHLREVVHQACPEVEETIKWGMPHFEHHGILCSMAAFKEHCAFNFWKGSLIVEDPDDKSDEGMGQLGRIRSLDDLPPAEVLAGYVEKAVELNRAGVPAPRAARPAKGDVEVPEDLAAALDENPQARATFEGFSPGQQREYVEWITEAKREATRQKRLETAVEWMAEGKTRHWKYR